MGGERRNAANMAHPVNFERNSQTTVRVPITHSEIEDSSYDTVFLIVELSDAMRRGVNYFSLDGEPLESINEVLNALVSDGEIVFDDDNAMELVRH